jgi:Zn-dependent peptidase ImmA (M78 family)
MYKPVYKKKSNGLPVVSRQELDIIGINIVEDFCPAATREPMPVDIDRLSQEYLGLDQDFKYLSHNCVYLGMIVFNDTDRVPVYNPVSKRAEYIQANAGTVLIDQSLLEDSQENRYRYTMGHEASHAILHKEYFNILSKQTNSHPLIQCRADSSRMLSKPKYRWTDNDWLEWHANSLSSSILMPANMVRQLCTELMPKPSSFTAAGLIIKTSMAFKVSIQAARIRLKELGIITRYSDSNIDYELSFYATALKRAPLSYSTY